MAKGEDGEGCQGPGEKRRDRGMRAMRAMMGLLVLCGICWLADPKGGVLGEETPAYRGFPISLNLKDADIVTVLHLIAEETGLNLVVADDVKGKLDIHLKNVPWDQALDEILRAKDLVKRQVGNVLHVYTVDGLKRELEIKDLQRGDVRKELEAEQKAREVRDKLRMDEMEAKPLVSRVFSIRYAKAQELQKNLLPHLSRDAKGQPRGSIEVNEFSNTLLVRDIPEVLDEISGLLARLDRPLPQILIEARIVEVNTDAVRDLGIQWGGRFQSPGGNLFGGASGISTSPQTGATITAIADRAFAVNFPAAFAAGGPTAALGVTLGTLAKNLLLDIQLSALETEGRAQILSRPKVITTDNFEAVIKRGEDIPYVLRRQADEVPDVQFKEAKLQLKVRPHVIGEDRITMDIAINNDARSSDAVVATGIEFPIISKQEAVTRALVREGETVVVGGIIQHTKRSTDSGVPYFKDIPVLSWLFGRKQRQEITRELLIFITPRILEEPGT